MPRTPTKFVASTYSIEDGETKKLGEFATLKQAQAHLVVAAGAENTPPVAEWNTPADRGQQAGTWGFVVDDAVEYLAETEAAYRKRLRNA